MTTLSQAAALAFAMSLAAASTALAQGPGPSENDTGHVKGLAIQLAPAGAAKLAVTSPAFKAGADIPFENTQYRGDIFPGLTWTPGPPGTKSYVAATQGALGAGDDLSGGTSIHFVMYDIPANLTAIPAGSTKPPAGAAMGDTVHGMTDFYAGPHTHNFTKHAYHFEVLALDTTIPVDPNMSLAKLEAAVKGHILATGELVGLAAMDPDSAEGKAFAAKQASGGKD